MPDYKIPQAPANLFKMPFADEGAKTIIPDTANRGRAALPEGFPSETQIPLSMGGVAPNRLDFQGILYMLSAFSFWQQSGGMFSYNPELNYAIPSIIYHNDNLWWCNQANGPATEAGQKEPGTNDSYWIEFFKKISGASGGGGLSPVGAMMPYAGTTAPDGWFMCDGSAFDPISNPQLYALLGKNTTPDMRGRFMRGYDPLKLIDPKGDRPLLSPQADAGRNATGFVQGCAEEGSAAGGICRLTYLTRGANGNKNVDYGFDIDLSRAWGDEHTSTEFTVANLNAPYIIRHD